MQHEFVMYYGAHHGFAVRSVHFLRSGTCRELTVYRADENDKDEAERGKKAEKQAVDFFTRWFSNPPVA